MDVAEVHVRRNDRDHEEEQGERPCQPQEGGPDEQGPDELEHLEREVPKRGEEQRGGRRVGERVGRRDRARVRVREVDGPVGVSVAGRHGSEDREQDQDDDEGDPKRSIEQPLVAAEDGQHGQAGAQRRSAHRA